MATTLGSQLKALALGRESVPGRVRTRPSLLFDPRKAADIDLQTIFSLAEAGLEELCSMENGAELEAYKSTLFSVQSIQTDREMQTKAFNDELNRSISGFLHRVSGFILLPACHQVLEYLIRRYKIQVYNVEDIMLVILPYHETSIFVRLVQLLHLENSRWTVFSGVKENGAAPPRDALVQRCLRDVGFLQAICDSGINPSFKSRIHATFTTVVLMEVLSSISIVNTDTVMRILPFILEALKQDVLDELRIGGILVIGVLSKRATLTHKLVSTIIEAVANVIVNLEDASYTRLAILAIVEITQTQDMDRLPKRACKSLLKFRDFFALLSEISKDYNTHKLVTLLIKFLCDRLDEKHLLEAASTLPLEKHLDCLVLGLIQKINSHEEKRDVLRNVLSAIEQRFPTELDACVNSLIQKENEAGAQLMDVLSEVFYGSLLRPIKESRSTLYASVDHPEAAVRRAAVSNIAELVKQPIGYELRQFIREALVRRLGDDDLAVVRMVLSVEGLPNLVPAEKLLISMFSLIHRCMDLIETGANSAAKEVVRTCLTIISIHFKEDPAFVKDIQRVLLCYLLRQEKTCELNVLFLEVARQFPKFLFTLLPICEEKAFTTKEEAVAWRSKCNQQIVDALSSVVLKDTLLMELLFEAAGTNENAKFVAVLVILSYFQKDSSGTMHELLKKCFSFLSGEWNYICTESSRSIPRGLQLDYESECDQGALYKKLEKSPSKAYAEVVLRSLYKVMQALLAFKNDNQIVDELFLLFAGSPDWKPFSSHLKALVERLSGSAILHLSKLFTPEEPLPEKLQSHGIYILATCFENSWLEVSEHLEISVPCVFTALRNPFKSVRQGAIACIKAISASFELFRLILDEEEAFVENTDFLPSFLDKTLRDDKMRKKSLSSILPFLLKSIEKLPLRVQTIMFELLRGVGHPSEKAQVTQPVLFQLLHRRRLYHLSNRHSASSGQCLKPMETSLICMLLEIKVEHVSYLLTIGEGLEKSDGQRHALWALVEALDVEGGSLKDDVVVQPCFAGLRLLASDLYSHLDPSSQDVVFNALLLLAAASDNVLRSKAQQTLDSLNVSSQTVSSFIRSLHVQGTPKKVKRAKPENQASHVPRQKLVSASISLLEFLLRTTKKIAWVDLLEPLFHLLRDNITGVWPGQQDILQKDVLFLRQLILTVLEGIITSTRVLKDPSKLDVDLLIKCASNASDAVTRKNTLAVITAIGRLHSDLVTGRVIDIFSVVGASTAFAEDSHSHKVIQELLESIVPSWLQLVGQSKSLLQIFVDALPRIPVSRRIELMKCVMRVANEGTSIPAFLFLLVRKSSSEDNQWAMDFAEEFCASYPLNTRALALLNFSIELLQVSNDWVTLRNGMVLLAHQLQRLQMRSLHHDLALKVSRSTMELALKQVQALSDESLMDQASLSCLEAAKSLLDVVTRSMAPSVFCETVTALLRESDYFVRRKVLQLYVAKLKSSEVVARKNPDKDFASVAAPHVEMAIEVLELLKSTEQATSTPMKQAAVSTLEMMAERFAATSSATFVSFLPTLVANFDSPSGTLVAPCIRCSASILTRVGPEALSHLPQLFNTLMKRARQTGLEPENVEVQSAVLQALEAAVEKLGGFMNPYIEDILSLLILEPGYTDPFSTNAESVSALRSLIAEKLPARLLLDPLANVYKRTLEATEVSAAAVFNILGTIASKMDRASVAAYHKKMFAFCMDALDLRRKRPKGFSSVHVVEESVIAAIISLVMKLNETTFKPLFVAVHDWAESTTLDGGEVGPSIDRSIVFFKLVNQLTEKLRSVFVPYFSYLLDGCVSRLSRAEEPSKKKKKARVEKSESVVARWHVQQLVISALHKCFLYDTVNFLDGPKFQQLLQPLANQLIQEIPAAVMENSKEADLPSAKLADEELVSCLVRMALKAGSDLYWKPLNHEVLMHTRHESQRAKILALDVVKSLASNLKEEYMVLIAETLPFLAELLEQELSIQAKAQEVFKLLEELSGESLSQYL